MLSISDYNQLKLLYANYKKFSELIKNLAEGGDWDAIENAITEKDAFLRKIIFFEKPRIKDIKDNDELISLRNEIIELEKQNIIFINNLKLTLLNTLNGVRQTKKLQSAYSPLGKDSISTFEISNVFEEE